MIKTGITSLATTHNGWYQVGQVYNHESFSRPLSPMGDHFLNILIVRLSAIGDVVHCLPLAAQIRARFPEAKITWIVEPPARALLQNNKAVDAVIVFEKKDLTTNLTNPFTLGTKISKIRSLLSTLSANQFDLAIDAQGLMKSAVIAWASGAPVRVGFRGAREGSSALMTDTFDPGDYYGHNRHVVDHNIDLGNFALETFARRKNLDLQPAPGVVRFPLPEPETAVRQRVADMMPAVESAPEAASAAPQVILNKKVVLLPGTTWATKIWPADKWIELGTALINGGVGRLIICGGKADLELTQSIYKGIDSRVKNNGVLIDLTAKTDLIELITLLQSCDLAVGADTGPMHLAAAVDGPQVVAVHGSTPWLRNGPYGPRGHAVYAGIPCQPCFSKTCKLPGQTIECLTELAPSRVLEIIEGVMKR